MENREIKFRAWGKDLNYDLPRQSNGLAQVVVYMNYNPSFYDGCNSDYAIYVNSGFTQDNRIWMQFTGLKDKNGKEIYEGDIARNSYNSIYGSYNYIEDVVYRNGYHFKNDGAHTTNQQIEVIGNIYETPELLTNGR